MSINYNDRKQWYHNYPILESNSDNGYKHHRAGAFAIHKGNEGFKFYIIRAVNLQQVTQHGRTYTKNLAYVQLVQCPGREIVNTPTRKRVTERYFNELYIIDTDKFIENEARVFTEMMELAKLRLSEVDTIDKIAQKHGDITV
ncbi:hypothetical protein phiAS5_ORF0030 [Aeromonas phage phiAS5]|uniref:Uncharacterized protein n=1 Tax=Aeromonas phage phiAS5 TaxID=879630 RepID=E1A2C7_9CAUD|nr:hypothetical protein phiAS5_ORF0030 [Aeromonas phage phiAS5]ADM79873.1 hypothetical protein phiAS5_ORF0030 [Aeromonas phage phiAS5]BES53021.1 hypothetical protein [Aeromonas phage phiWae14]